MSTSFVVEGARVLTDSGESDPRRLVVVDGVIVGGEAPSDATVVSAEGMTLMPGLIDTHMHIADRELLTGLAQWGVTTGLDMAAWPTSRIQRMKDDAELADLRSAGTPAAGTGGNHAQIPGFPIDALIATPEDGRAFVEARIAEGVDYIKIVTEAAPPQGIDAASADAIVQAAHERGLLVVAHAVTGGAYRFAVERGADVITHAPLDEVLDDETIARMVAAGQVASPTLTMMAGTANAVPAPHFRYENARDSVTRLHEAGVRILAGTDANATPGVPFSPRHGETMHEELQRLVEAGLAPLEALRGATDLAADTFGLGDRGVLTIGRRADLLLVHGDPTTDIAATRRIAGVWLAGDRIR